MKTKTSETIRFLTILFGCLVLTCQCYATVPANDNFADRALLTGTNLTATGSTLGATKEAGEPAVGFGTGTHSVWWTWTAPTNGRASVQVGSSFYTVGDIYTGDTLTNLSWLTRAAGLAATNTVGFDVVAGAVYQLRVDAYSSGNFGDYSLRLVFTAAPTNDNFADRIALAGTNVTVTGSNLGATRELGEPNIKALGGGTYISGNHTVWWTWTAPANGRAKVAVAGDGFGIVAGVYTGSAVTNLAWLSSVHSSSGTNVTVEFDVAAGQAYQLVVDSLWDPAGNYQLSLAYSQVWAGDRTLTGAISGSLPKGRYVVMNGLQVESNQSLTIEAGSTFLFSPTSTFAVAGTLIAKGEDGEPIRFLSVLDTPQSGDWQGLAFSNPGQPQSILDHIEVAYASTGVSVGQGLANLLLTNSLIHNCQDYGVYVMAGSGTYFGTNEIQILNNFVTSNGYDGIQLCAYSYGTSGSANGTRVSGNEVANNGGTGIRLSGNGSGVMGSTSPQTGLVNGQVSENYVHHNADGIFASGYDGYRSYGRVSSVLRNNLVVSNLNSGVKLDGKFSGQVVNNTIIRNGSAGVYHSINDNNDLNLMNNLVIANGNGFVASAIITNATVAVNFNNVFANVTNDWINYPMGFGITSTTNRNGFPADPQMNITADPQFVSISDFHLAPNSPCVNAGTNQTWLAGMKDLDGKDRILHEQVDIGAYETILPNWDIDCDGIPDWWEQQYFGGPTNANLSAVCSNGFNTVHEAYIAGLNPNDPQSTLRSSIPSNGKMVGWNAVSGRVYSVYWTTNLLSGFHCLESNIPWTRCGFTNSTTVPCGYYKIDVRLAE